MEINPWKVDSLEAFTCLKCPECAFFSKEESNFRNHATENHQLSSEFFEQLDNQSALYYEENNIKENTSAEDLSKQSNSFSTGFYRAATSADTFVNCENTMNTCAIVTSGQNQQFILSMDNFHHIDELSLSIQETENNQCVSDRLSQNGNSLEAEVLPLHYPEVCLTEGTDHNSSMEVNIDTVHEGERNKEKVHEGERNIETVHEGEEVVVKPVISKHLVCEKSFKSQSELDAHTITAHHSDNIKNSNQSEYNKQALDSQNSLKCHVEKSELIQKEKNESVDLKKFHFFKSANSQIPESNSSMKIQENRESNDTNFLESTIHKGKKSIPR